MENLIKTQLEKIAVEYKSKEWYELRRRGIFGSDAASAIGQSKWKSAYELLQEKTGRKAEKSLDGNELVEYGLKAEDALVKLFALDYSQYEVLDTKGFVYKRGFMGASLDAELIERGTGKKGFLEIKTTTIRTATQKAKWDNGVPQEYYIQVLHYLLTTGFDFAVLKVQIKEYDREGDLICTTKHFRFDKADCLKDMQTLYEQEKRFYECVEQDKMPTINIMM